MYTTTKLRGKVEVIEDAPVTCDTTVRIRMDKKPEAVYTAPERRPLPYSYENGILEYTVDRFTLHQMVVIERKK